MRKILCINVITGTILICLALINFSYAENPTNTPSNSTPQYGSSEPNPTGNASSTSSDNFLFTGSFITSFPIVTPPGTNNLEPNLELVYNSSAGGTGWLGVGWDLSLGVIQRSTKNGIPTYDISTDTFTFTLKGTTEELSYVGQSEYRAKIESGFIKFYFENNTWYAWDKSSTQYIFGSNSNSQVVNPDNYSQIYSWWLDEVIDTNGNYMTISYTKDQNQIYPDEIKYTGNIGINPTRLVKFNLGTHSYIIDSYRSGFKVATAKRLESIEMWVGSEFVRRYEFEYYGSEVATRPLLKLIRQVGDNQSSSLPETKFEYQNSVPNWTQGSSWTFPVPFVQSSVTGGPTGGGEYITKDLGVQLADVNADGLIDVIKAINDGTITKKVYINNGASWTEDSSWVFPEIFVQIDGDIVKSKDVRLADVNGDSLVDVIKATDYGISYTESKIYINNGTSWIEDPNWRFPCGFSLEVDPIRRDRGVRIVDINGDGLPDVIKGLADNISGTTTKKIYINNGTGWTEDSIWSFPEIFSEINNDYPGGKDTGVRLTDINSDGLVDIVRAVINQGVPTRKVYIHNGYGWTEDSSWNFPCDFISNFVTGGPTGEYITKDLGVHLADLNGDGLIDIVKAIDGTKKVYINDGRGWIESLNWTFPEIFVKTYSYDDYGHDTGLRLADIDGDGLVDIIHSQTGPTYVNVCYLKNQPIPNILNKVINILGGKTEISYTPSTKFENTQLPYVMQVTTKIVTNNGLENSVTTTYDYKGGYYDFETKEFLGFNQVTKTDAEGNFTISYFKQDEDRYNDSTTIVNIFKGKLYQQKQYDSGGKVLSQVDTDWESTQPYGGNIPVFFPYPVRVDKMDANIHDFTAKYSAIRYEYDQYGNLTKVSNLGDTSITGDERYSFIEYTYNTNKYLLNLPKRQITSNVDNINSKLTETLYYYDNASNINSEPTKGNLTKKEEWLDKENRYLPTNMEYDGYGNMTSLTDPRGNTTITTYDSIYHTYPEQITNPKGHIYKYTYNPKFGVIEQETDPNNVTTYYRYDEFGRLKKTIGHYDTESQPTTEYVYNLTGTAPNETIAYQRINHGESLTLDIRTFTDGLGRTIRTENPGPDGKKIISDEVSFNNRGLPEKRYLPYFANSSSAGYSITTYDALGRITKVDNPDGTYTHTNYYTWAEEQIDENGNRHKYTTDAYNRIIKVEEYKDNQTYTTTYEYDALGRLTKIINSLSTAETTSIFYDSLGRKTQMEDPKMGTWKYRYDDNGNLTSQQDNKDHSILMSYDAMNRIQTKTYPQDVGVTYQYDNATKPNCISRLDYVDDATGRTTFEYDKLGQITKTIKKLGTNEYTTEFTYNAMGQQTNITYPDEEHELVNYTYNNGFLESVHSSINYITDIDYQATGQIANLTYGNGVTTQYNYNPQNLRLTTLKTYNTKGTIQQFSYSYDNVGNITNILDVENTATQAFGYDELNRIEQAVGIGTYAQKYEYDSVGNLTMALPSTKRVPEDYPTIQQAIDASKAGDVINVSPNTYNENITLKQGVIIQSTDVPASTIIQGTGGPVVTATGGETQTTILRGFTITGGTGAHPGIYCKDSSPSIIHNIIKNNTGDASMSTGGGISLYNSSALVMYNIIQENKAEYGGGIFCDNEDNPDAEAPKIYQNKISSNTATSEHYNLAGAGGGVYVHQANARITDNIITQNTGQFGGGIYVYTAKPTITDNKIDNNTANFGGGIFCDNDAKPEITNNLITNNRANQSQTENPMGGGGGIYSHESDPVIDNNTITNNTSAFFGGGIYAYNSTVQITHNKLNNNSTDPDYGGFGGGIFFDAGTSASVQDSQINFNSSPSGAGIYSNSSSIALINNKIMYNNSTGYGAGMYCSDSSVNITNNQLTNNTAGSDGAGIWCVNNTGGRIINNVFSYNTAGLFGGGVYISGALSLDFANNIVSDNKLTSPEYGTGQEIFVSPPFELPTAYNNIYYGSTPQYSAYYGWAPGTGDVGVDPKFLNPQEGDYHLKDGSLCINWGDPNPSYNDPDGSRNDMGNYGGPLAKVVLKADAGYDQIAISSSTVTLDGTWSSYPNGIEDFDIEWEQTEGEPTYNIQYSTNPLEASFTPTQEGLYVFRLTITADTNTSSDEVSIWVEDEFIPPYTTTTFQTQTYDDIEYDLNGNMVKIGGRNISYDYENRPTTIVMPTEAGKIITYTYDYAGQRVKKEVTEKDRAEQALTRITEKLEELGFSQFSRIFERFILQRASRPSPPRPSPPRRGSPPQQNPPSQESEVTYYVGNLYEVKYTTTTTVATKYVYANGMRVADTRCQPVPTVASGIPDASRSVSYYHSDHLGSSNIITDSSGNKVQLLEYVPFGTTRLSQGTAQVSYRFTGQMLDNETGLYYYSARWYEPVIGKFITPDTIIQAPYDPQSLNRYAYVRNNPVKYVDPTGNYFGEGVVNAIASFFSSLFGGNGGSQTGTSSSGDSKVANLGKAPKGTTTVTPDSGTDTGEESSYDVEGDGTWKAKGKQTEGEKVKQMSDAELLKAVDDAAKSRDGDRIRVLMNEVVRRNERTPKKTLQKAIKNTVDIIFSKETGGIPITPIVDLAVESAKEDVQYAQETVVKEAMEAENRIKQFYMPRHPFSPSGWVIWGNNPLTVSPSSEK